MWVQRYVDDHGLWGVVMGGRCPWCRLTVERDSDRHAHALTLNGNLEPTPCVSATDLYAGRYVRCGWEF